MSWLKTIVREILGLFVDNGSLAIAIVFWLAVTGLILPRFSSANPWNAVILFVGLGLILIENAIREARRSPSNRYTSEPKSHV
jgi:hypothetical protein